MRNSIISFLPQMTLLRSTFLLRLITVTVTLLNYLFLLNLFFALQYLSVYWEIQIMYFSQFPMDFLQIQNKMHHFTVQHMTTHIHIWLFSCGLGWSPRSFEICFKLGAFVTTAEFCVWVQVRININITHLKYFVKPHSPP